MSQHRAAEESASVVRALFVRLRLFAGLMRGFVNTGANMAAAVEPPGRVR